MRTLSRNRRWLVEATLGASLASVAVVAASAYALINGRPATHEQVIGLLVNIILAVSLQVFSGNSGVLSFGHMTFVGIGAYVSAFLTLDPSVKESFSHLPESVLVIQFPFLPAVILAAAVTGFIAYLIGVPIFKLSGPSAVIAIFALVLAANVVFNGWTDITRGSGGLYGIPKETTLLRAMGFAVLTILVARSFRDSSAGLQLRASSNDELAAASVGVRVRRMRLQAWWLSAVMSAVAGALIAHQLTAFSPTNFFILPAFSVVTMLIIGGRTTVSGAVIGATSVTLIQEVLRPLENRGMALGPLNIERFTGLTQLALVLTILAAMYFRREGLTGRREIDESLTFALRSRRTGEQGN